MNRWTLCLVVMLLVVTGAVAEPRIKLGVDMLQVNGGDLLKGKRVGLITNLSGVNSKLESTIDVINSFSGVTLTCLFGPEHGIRGSVYAGEKVKTMLDERTGIPVYSLYGNIKAPDAAMMKRLDVLVFDIQDIGSRTYTYVWTMTECMKAAKKYNKTFVVLDRPNPINGLVVEGNTVEKGFESSIGRYPVAYCHGMTVGELALFCNTEYEIGCDLRVVQMEGWQRWMTWSDTGLAWTPTSPHIPEDDSSWYYPTTGIFGELKVINHGIGYTLPFKVVGSTTFRAYDLASTLNSKKLPGVYFQPFWYTPFYGKQINIPMEGVKIVITDTKVYQPVNTGYHIMAVIQKMYPAAYEWNTNKRVKSFALANGTDNIRKMLMAGKSAEEIIGSWQKDLEKFKEKRAQYLIYP